MKLRSRFFLAVAKNCSSEKKSLFHHFKNGIWCAVRCTADKNDLTNAYSPMPRGRCFGRPRRIVTVEAEGACGADVREFAPQFITALVLIFG
jgi:hypothetical protein